MAQRKLDDAHVQSLIAFYKKSQADHLANKIALEIGGATSIRGSKCEDASLAERSFQGRVKLLYDAATNGGQRDLSASRLREYVHHLGIRGSHESQLETMFQAYDCDGNAILDCDEFETMIREISEHCHLFTGKEMLGDLSIVQLRTLVTFDFEKEVVEFDDEVGNINKVPSFTKLLRRSGLFVQFFHFGIKNIQSVKCSF